MEDMSKVMGSFNVTKQPDATQLTELFDKMQI